MIHLNKVGSLQKIQCKCRDIKYALYAFIHYIMMFYAYLFFQGEGVPENFQGENREDL